jgi:RNA polymerase sigma-70 factor (ECF subfamily)
MTTPPGNGFVRHIANAENEARLLYDAILTPLYRYFCYRVGDPDLAEDLTAETLERAWRSRTTYRPDRGPFVNWVFGIARKVKADHFRKARQSFGPEDPSSSPPPGLPEEELLRKTEFARLTSLLAKLPERQRQLIALKYGAEMSNKEIALLTGLSETNVGSILHRVVTALRTLWEVVQ